MNNTVNVEWPEWKKIINEHFIPLVNNQSRYLILYGGRGSSKSNFTAKKLIYRCLSEPYFKCILIRRVADTIRESSYKEIQEAVRELGLDELFKFTVNPLQIECYNGNTFLCRGTSDGFKLKSIKDPTCIWWEEEIPDEDDFTVITSGVRTTRTTYLQEIFTVNTDVEGEYTDHWFYKRFFAHRPIEKDFTDHIQIPLPNGKTLIQSTTVHHSTYNNNRWTSDAHIALMEGYKRNQPYYHLVYNLGEWGHRQTGGLFYKGFNRALHTQQNVQYNPAIALHVSFDFNVQPYCSATIWQVSGNTAWCIDEIATTTPNNNTLGLCREFSRKYFGHYNGLFIYGDASGKHEDTRSEKGYNDFSIIKHELKQFHPSFRVPNRNPAVAFRGNFINEIFSSAFNGISLIISEKCKHLLQDFTFLKEDADGTKKKQKVNDNGVTYEKYGHHSDTLDYFVCEAFKDQMYNYQNGNVPLVRLFGSRHNNSKLKY